MNKTGKSRILLRSAFIILHSALALALSGCDQAGAVGGLIARAVPRTIDASYKGLANQNVIIMIWMDRSMRADHPDLQLDIATSLQGKLIAIESDQKPALLKGTIFPVMAQTVIQYQQDHPEINFEPVTATAAKFKGTRLIFVEIKEFDTHAGAPELFRGTMKGDLKVVEMTEEKDHTVSTKVAFHEEDIAVVFPKDSPNDGLPIGTESKITDGTLDLFTDEIAKRFYPHQEDRD